MPETIYRRAHRDELPAILALQKAVFSGEQHIPPALIDAFLENAPTCWCAIKDGVLIATAAAWQEHGQYHWGRFAVLPQWRGQHIGTTLARLAFDDLFKSGVDTLCMEARDATVHIVSKLGGQITGAPVPFYDGNVTPMLLLKEDYLKNAR